MVLSNCDKKWAKLASITEAIEARKVLGFDCSDSDLGRLRGFKVECTPVNINQNHICTLSANVENKEYILSWSKFKEICEI